MSFLIAIYRFCTIFEVMEMQIGATLVGTDHTTFNTKIFFYSNLEMHLSDLGI